MSSTSSTRRHTPPLLLLAVALLAVAAAMSMAVVSAQSATTAPAPTPQLTPTDGCCALCIGKTTDLPYTYDPVVHSQCAAARGVCCYNCGQDAAAQMTVVNGAFGTDGVTPQVKAGEWAQVQWPNVARVTYETYQAAQKKVTTVRNGSFEARAAGGSFWICAKTQGSFIYARGWGANACLSATKENRIEVVAGKDSDSCGRLPSESAASKGSGSSASAPASSSSTPATKAPASGSAQTLTQGDTAQTCNTQRATVVVNADGRKQCVCAAEWTSPPACDGFPWWKIALTVGGGVAAVLSIIVSVRAYVNTRKANRAATTMSPDAVLGSDSVPVVTAAARAATPSRKPAHEDYERHRQRDSDAPMPMHQAQPQQPAPASSHSRRQPGREYTL